MKTLIWLVALPIAGTASPLAAIVSDTEVVVGAWKISSEADPMTDELSCVAYYDGRKDVQLTEDSFAISYRGRGGVQGYEYRIDDSPSSGMQLPTGVEKRVGAILLKGPKFEPILSSSRVRVQAVTFTSGLVNDDIDTKDVQRTVAKMLEMGCV